jgi:hypothetical protein
VRVGVVRTLRRQTPELLAYKISKNLSCPGPSIEEVRRGSGAKGCGVRGAGARGRGRGGTGARGRGGAGTEVWGGRPRVKKL